MSRYTKRITISTKQLCIDIIHTHELCNQFPRFLATEQIEHYNHDNSRSIEINHGDRSYHISHKSHNNRNRDPQPYLARFPYLVYQCYQKQSYEKCPKYILMKQVQDAVSGHKIKRNFRYHCKYKHSAQISAEITGVIKSLNYHESKYRKCYSSYARKYIHIWKQRCPHMITEHACHRNNMQHTGAEYSCLYIP